MTKLRPFFALTYRILKASSMSIAHMSLGVIALLLMPSLPARADLILGNLNSPSADTAQNFVLGSNSAISVGLTTKSSLSIDSVDLYLKANNQQSGFIATLKLRSDDNNKPGATMAAFNSVTIPEASFSRLSFTPTNSMLLDANATYWFTLESNFVAIGDALLIGAGASAADPAATSFASSNGTRFGPSSDQSSVFPFAPSFQVNGITAVPEPSSFALAVLPLIYLASRRFRRTGPLLNA